MLETIATVALPLVVIPAGTLLSAVGLGAKVEAYFGEMLAGPGAVRATLHKSLG